LVRNEGNVGLDSDKVHAGVALGIGVSIRGLIARTLQIPLEGVPAEPLVLDLKTNLFEGSGPTVGGVQRRCGGIGEEWQGHAGATAGRIQSTVDAVARKLTF
jgi:hypothetical protein